MANQICTLSALPAPEQILSHRLRVHHLDALLPKSRLVEAVGVCGMQNSPPGGWETAAFNRVADITSEELAEALYHNKELLQAWSFRGAPYIFPAVESAVFLSPLEANGREPWIYTDGVRLALDLLGMPFDLLLILVDEACGLLETCTVKSKADLDKLLAQAVRPKLPAEKQPIWDSPSMYGPNQTVGEAVVSFLLRPCSFRRRVVFGRREGATPTFTGFQNWMGFPAHPDINAAACLVEKFLHAYAPAHPGQFAEWLGCSTEQARRLWDSAGLPLVQFSSRGKSLYALETDLISFTIPTVKRTILLSSHDPYLDLRDRERILPDKKLQRLVWRTVSNPGAVLSNGKIIGIWKTVKSVKTGVSIQVTLWENPDAEIRSEIIDWSDRWAAFRGKQLLSCTLSLL